MNYSCSTALKKSTGVKTCSLNNIYEPLLRATVRDFSEELIIKNRIKDKLEHAIRKLSMNDAITKKYVHSKKTVKELGLSLENMMEINTNSILEEKVKRKKIEFKKAQLENYMIKSEYDKKYSVEYFKYLLDEYRTENNIDLLNNVKLKSLIHKIVVKDQENIYIVLSSDSTRGTKGIINFQSLENSDVIASKTLYKQRKGKKLSLRYKVIFYTQ